MWETTCFALPAAGGSVAAADFQLKGTLQLSIVKASLEIAFGEEDRPDAYSPAAAHLAWERTLSFLHERLA